MPSRRRTHLAPPARTLVALALAASLVAPAAAPVPAFAIEPGDAGALDAARDLAPATGPATAAAIEPAAQVSASALRVCIDPGHGGVYSGAYYGGVAEKTLNLRIARSLAAELRSRGIAVDMTRNSDTKLYRGGGLRTWRWSDSQNQYLYQVFPANDATDRLRLDLQARCDAALASGADLFVSIHCNAGGTSARGIEVYSAPNDPLGSTFARDVQERTIARTGAVNRGAKQANFYVTRWSNQPAVLVESGFMSNATERARLRSSSYQAKLADGIADGIEQFVRRGVSERFDRIAGASRYDTAVEVSKRGWPEGAETVFLASGERFADSLVAAPLAAREDGPILTSTPGRLEPVVAAELARLAPDRIVVVGGTESMPESVAAAAALASGIPTSSVERIAGRDRYDVSLAVARELESESTTAVVVASGEVWPDALSIAGSAARRGEPILLARPTGLSDGAAAFIASEGATRTVTVVGGTKTLPAAALRGLPFTRIAGADRYETNWQVFQQRATEAERLTPMIASGERFPDALVLGPLVAKNGRPVLLVGKAASSKELRPWVYRNRAVAMDVDVVGGTASVSAYLSTMFDKWKMNEYR